MTENAEHKAWTQRRQPPHPEDAPEGSWPTEFRPANITGETVRKYYYPDGSVFQVVNGVTLLVKTDERGDSHRIIDADDEVFYPRRGWTGISWKVREGVTKLVQF